MRLGGIGRSSAAARLLTSSQRDHSDTNAAGALTTQGTSAEVESPTNTSSIGCAIGLDFMDLTSTDGPSEIKR